MPTIGDLVATRESECEALEDRAKSNLRETELILDTATSDGRSHLTLEETHRVTELQSARDWIRRELKSAKAKRDEARGILQEEVDRMSASEQVTPTETRKPAYDRVARVGAEERTYRPDDQRSGRPSFFRDLAMGQVFRDPSADARLARHAHENEVDGLAGSQQRAIGTGAVSGLVPPEYVTEQFAELARAGRPVANAVQSMPLPDTGMTVNVSRITTGTSAASQATENQAVSENNADDTLLSRRSSPSPVSSPSAGRPSSAANWSSRCSPPTWPMPTTPNWTGRSSTAPARPASISGFSAPRTSSASPTPTPRPPRVSCGRSWSTPYGRSARSGSRLRTSW